MPKRKHLRRAYMFASALALAIVGAASFDQRAVSSSSRRAGPVAAQDTERVDIRLRSLTTRATGKLTVEASEGGGRARLTALNLPDPQTVAAGARTYVVWAVSGGRIVRLGELKRDERGNGGLAFDRPEGLEHYGVIVTAEATADAVRPSDPVLSSRADEAAALYPPKKDESAKEAGAARTTVRESRAYVRVNLRAAPLPPALGANVYALWAVMPDSRLVYMGSLPAGDALNTAEVSVRVADFDAHDYTLFVTAEQQRPAPSGHHTPDTSAVEEIFRQEQLAVENLKKYAYKRRLVFQTDRGERYERVSELVYLDSDRNYERRVLLLKPSLGRVRLTNLNFDGAEVILRPQYRAAYTVTFRGEESGQLAFEVKTKEVEGALLFQGTIWTDDKYRIVAASGEVVPEFLPGGAKTFKFTAHRKDGLPLSLEIEDRLGRRRVYQSVSYYDFKLLRADVTVIEEGEPGGVP